MIDLGLEPHTLRYVVGDTAPWIEGGIDADIGGWSIALHVRYRPEPLIKPATITDAAKGEFRFEWEPGDLIAGDWDAEIRFTDLHGESFTARGLRLIVVQEIA